GRRRHGRDLADADAAAGNMLETAFVEMHVDWRRVGNSGNPVIFHSAGKDVAGSRIDLARFVERIAKPLDHRSRRLTAGERGRCDLADGDAGVDVDNPHTPE